MNLQEFNPCIARRECCSIFTAFSPTVNSTQAMEAHATYRAGSGIAKHPAR
jgi:hypothetical protein